MLNGDEDKLFEVPSMSSGGVLCTSMSYLGRVWTYWQRMCHRNGGHSKSQNLLKTSFYIMLLITVMGHVSCQSSRKSPSPLSTTPVATPTSTTPVSPPALSTAPVSPPLSNTSGDPPTSNTAITLLQNTTLSSLPPNIADSLPQNATLGLIPSTPPTVRSTSSSSSSSSTTFVMSLSTSDLNDTSSASVDVVPALNSTAATLAPATPTNGSMTSSMSSLSFSTSQSLTIALSSTTDNMTSRTATSKAYMGTQTTSSSNVTKVSGPVVCNFSQSCADQSVYYWMVVAITVSGDEKNESDVNSWLWNLFQNNLLPCVIPPETNNNMTTQLYNNRTTPPSQNLSTKMQTNNFTSETQTRNYSMSTIENMTSMISNDSNSYINSTTLTNNWPLNTTRKGTTISNLLQGIEITCVNKTGIRKTNCTVLLRLGQPINTCCFYNVFSLGGMNSSIQAYVVGKQVERVGRGLCNMEDNPPLSGSFEKCNGSLPDPNVCNSTGPVNASCTGLAGTVYVPYQNQSYCNTSIVDNTSICNCDAYCNGNASYYYLNLSFNEDSQTISDITTLINSLKYPSSCSGSTPSTECLSGLHLLDTLVNCEYQYDSIGTCHVTVETAKNNSVCDVSKALMTLFKGLNYSGVVTEIAICGGSGIGSNLLNSSISNALNSLNVNATELCEISTSDLNILECVEGEHLYVFLNQTCDPMHSSTTSSPNINTTGNRKTTTSTLLTTTANATVTGIPNTTFTLSTPLTSINTTTTASTANTSSTTKNSSIPIITTVSFSNTTTTPVTTATALSDEALANQLLDQTSNASRLNSSQVDQLVSQLEGILAKPNVSMALGNTSIHIVSNLLGASQNALASSSKRVIGIVDTVGQKLVINGGTETVLSQSLALLVTAVDGGNFKETSFSISDPSNVQVQSVPRARRSVRASLPQGSIRLPSSLTQNLSPQQQGLASRVQFNFYQKSTVFQDSSLGNRKLISGILGASVANLSITGLKDNVVITLRNSEPIPANFVASCVFWNFSLNDGSGGWSTGGCSVLNSTANETVCGCNHLTSFGILLDISRQPITSPLQAEILTYISYIGCGISAIFLSVTLLTYLAFGKLRKDIPSKILIQLCIALLSLNFLFLVDGWLALYPDQTGLCISTAWFLHYFLIASFTWMGLESVHMYLALVKVFNTYIPRYMLKFSLVGWGVPLIVVIVVIAVSKDNYGLVDSGRFTNGSIDDFCWLKPIPFYVAVVAYFCVIFLFNLIMFVVVMVQLCRIKRKNPHNMQYRSGLQDLRSVAGITILLGLSWGFAFFAWGPVHLAFMYLFTIFNSLQGLFIFVFHCAMKENVRRQWRTFLCCGRLRLAENSEWSRTATEMAKKSMNRGTSVNSMNSSQSNNSSSSLFLASDTPVRLSGIGNPYGDSTITALEDPHSDVVLNEVHRINRNQ